MTGARTRSRARDGFALPTAIMALVLLSALVAGALFVATEELQSGRSDMADQRALAAAEWALDRGILEWDVQRNTAQAVGKTVVIDARETAPNDSVIVTATRVGRYAVWMTAAATSRPDGRSIPARHTVAASLRLAGPVVPARAALTARGLVSIDGGLVDGRGVSASGDTTGLCGSDQPGAGISIADASRVTCVTCSGPGSGVFGSPPIDSTPALDSTSARELDSASAALAARATIALPGGTFTTRPSVQGDGCNRVDVLNWGDPLGAGPCVNWFPIVHVRGASVLASGSVGQGILIVNGSLRVEANARFVGVVMASGGIDVDGVGAEIIGAAYAGDANGGTGTRVANGGAIRLGVCALRRATLGTARLERTPDRWWAELR